MQILSFILRLWAEGPPEARVWRASLTHLPDGERIGFASLEEATLFLKEQIETQNRLAAGKRD